MILFVGIPAVFAHAEYIWPVMTTCAAFGLGWICGRCAQRV